MSDRVKITPEHIEQLKPYLQDWVKKTFEVHEMTDDDRISIKQAIGDIAEASNKFYANDKSKQLAPIQNVVFTKSPFVMRLATSIAAYMWHNHHLGKPNNINLADYKCESPVAQAVIDAVKQATYGMSQSIVRPECAAAYDTSNIRDAKPLYDEMLVNLMYEAFPSLTIEDENSCELKAIYTTVLEQTFGVAEYMTFRAWMGMMERIASMKLGRMLNDSEKISEDDDFFYVNVDELAGLFKQIKSQEDQFSNKYFDNYYSMFQGEFHYTPSEMMLSFYLDVIGIKDPKFDIQRAWQKILFNCGLFVMYPDFCMACERPEGIHMDTEGRFFNDRGAAVKWRDGTGFYLVHDVIMPWWIIEHPERITPKKINDHANLEQRRVMLNIFTPGRYVQEMNAKLLSKTDSGELYRADMPNDEPLLMVKVLNSTPEPDGSRKEYWLRVRPDCTNADEAVASTFGMTVEEYKPAQQT